MTSESKSDKEINKIASIITKKALRNIKEQKLSDEWNELSILMATTRIQSLKNDSKESQRKIMFDILDSFNLLYARTEALLPINKHSNHSTIEDPEDFELFSMLNNRLHVMDLKYSRYIENIPQL